MLVQIIYLDTINYFIYSCHGGIRGVEEARKHFLTFEGTATDSEFHYIPRLFTLSCCHQRCSLDCDRMQMTHFSFYDHDATQSECAPPGVYHIW